MKEYVQEYAKILQKSARNQSKRWKREQRKTWARLLF